MTITTEAMSVDLFRLRYLPSVLLVFILGSCTAMDSKQAATGPAVAAATPATTVDAPVPLSTSASSLADQTVAESRRAPPTIFRGNDTQVRMPAAEEPVRFVGDDVSLNFEQAPLAEVMHAVMGDILQLDYVVDQPVKGQVTLRTRTPIPRDELLQVLESLLKANNALLVKGSDGRYLVTGAARGSRLAPAVSNPRSSDPGYSTIVVPLRYISASNMAEILQPVADESSFVLVDNSRNIMMLAGTREQLDGWLDIVNTFDVDQLSGMSVGLFPLENSSVEDVAEALSAMLETGEQGDIVRVVPVKRLNSLLLITPRSHYLDTLGVWIERLDSAADSLFEKRLFVYPVQNTSAKRLSELLNSIYVNELSVQTTSAEVNSDSLSGIGVAGGVAPGLSSNMIGEGASGAARDFESSGSNSSAAVADTAFKNTALQDVRVVADEENNALMIYSTGKQYAIIEAALMQLDVVATQVLIEASILEVSLTDELEYGLEWTFSNSIGNQREGTGILDAAVAAATGGFSYTVRNNAGDIKAELNALASEGLVNIISTPSVMVLDNNAAYIHVGDQVPIRDSTTFTDGGNEISSISYKDTGVQLKVRPSVNAGGLITMDIEQSVTDVGEIDIATRQREFLERSIMSRVAVRSTESVVLGGLIRENANDTTTGIPFLSSLPLVGALFGSTVQKSNRTELLVIITPRALYTESELREVGREMRSQVRHMELLDPAR